jgi:hypothetical protein
MPEAQRLGRRPIDFACIARVALLNGPALVRRWLPDGRFRGREYEARNPTRVDHHSGSFRVNLTTGKWADFARGDKGGDLISLAAYLGGISQREAALALAAMFNLDPTGDRTSPDRSRRHDRA